MRAQDRGTPRSPGREASGPSTDSSAPMIGCVGCLAVGAIVIVDALPFLGIQGAIASGDHAPWAVLLLFLLGLTTGPIVAGLFGYLAFRYRDGLLAAIERRWRGSTSRENAAALNLEELTAVAAVILGLAAGALIGISVVQVLSVTLP